jgi:hypothetical protein
MFPSIRGGAIMIAKLFRDGTVSAGAESPRDRRSKFGFFLDWIMMSKAAGNQQQHLNRL